METLKAASLAPAVKEPKAEPSLSESQVLFKQRLTLVGKAGFFLGTAFYLAVPAVILAAGGGRHIGQYLLSPASLLHLASFLLMGGMWQFVRRTRLGPRELGWIDAGAMILMAAVLGLMGGTHPQRVTGMFHSVVAMAIVLSLRAVGVPSTGRKTLFVSGIASGTALCAVAICFWRAPDSDFGMGESSRLASLVEMALWVGGFTAVTTVASHVIYGLRQEVKTAKQYGQYVLGDKLGEGGMGTVYKATHAMLRRETAIKLLPPDKIGPEALARFEREVCETARLTHPNTVAIFDYGRTPEGVFYYAMEYLRGLDLDALVQATGPLPAGRVVHLLQQVCASLCEAHEMGLIHRDIKPGNIVVTERGGVPDVVKVLDFGLVKDLQGGSEAALTAVDSITGTPLYLSPEAVSSPSEVGPASDLYAVSAVGYFLLTGCHVFSGATLIAICAHHMTSQPEPPSSRLGAAVPGELERLILQGLSKKPEDRPRSARAMRTALLECAGVETWSDDDARSWWESTGRKLLGHGSTTGQEVRPFASTIAVDFAAR